MASLPFDGSLNGMKINHATFTDALQIALSIDGPGNWKEKLEALELPRGWSIAVSVESTVIFDVKIVDPWVTAGVHHDLVALGLRTPAMLDQKHVLQDLANSTWRVYEQAINPELTVGAQESAWRQLDQLVDHVVTSKLHLQAEWSYIATIVAKHKDRLAQRAASKTNAAS